VDVIEGGRRSGFGSGRHFGLFPLPADHRSRLLGDGSQSAGIGRRHCRCQER